jgi:hypothetical protein
LLLFPLSVEVEVAAKRKEAFGFVAEAPRALGSGMH